MTHVVTERCIHCKYTDCVIWMERNGKLPELKR